MESVLGQQLCQLASPGGFVLLFCYQMLVGESSAFRLQCHAPVIGFFFPCPLGRSRSQASCYVGDWTLLWRAGEEPTSSGKQVRVSECFHKSDESHKNDLLVKLCKTRPLYSTYNSILKDLLRTTSLMPSKVKIFQASAGD